MSTGLLYLIAAAIVLFALVGICNGINARIQQHGIHALAWRWLTGHPWHGKAITDAGWLRPGKKALTRTGYAPRFHYRPPWQRTAMRSGGILSVIFILYGLVVNAQLTIDCVLAGLGLWLAWSCWRLWQALQRRQHRRAWVEPLHAVCAPLVGIPLANPPKSWLAIEPDRSKAVLALPAGRDFSDPKAQEQLARAASAKLGLEAPEVSWRLGGPEPALTIRRSEPPPDEVLLAGIRKVIDESGDEVLVLGLGKGGPPVTVSLDGDSPHAGLTMGSGGGKSVTSRLILGQQLHKGCLVGYDLGAELVRGPRRHREVGGEHLPGARLVAGEHERGQVLPAVAATGRLGAQPLPDHHHVDPHLPAHAQHGLERVQRVQRGRADRVAGLADLPPVGAQPLHHRVEFLRDDDDARPDIGVHAALNVGGDVGHPVASVALTGQPQHRGVQLGRVAGVRDIWEPTRPRVADAFHVEHQATSCARLRWPC